MLDGHDLSGRFIAVEAMTIPAIGPNLTLAGGAEPGDGLMDLVLVGPEQREVLTRLTRPSATGGPRASSGLPVARGRHLLFEADPACPLHVDDDPWPASGRIDGEVHVQARDGTVDILVPAGWRRAR